MLDTDLQEKLRVHYRMLRIFRQMHMSQKDRLIILALLTEPRPWRVSTLADEIGYTRAAVRAALVATKGIVTAEDPKTGWTLLPAAREQLTELYREIFDIAEGRRKALSPALLEQTKRISAQIVGGFQPTGDLFL